MLKSDFATVGTINFTFSLSVGLVCITSLSEYRGFFSSESIMIPEKKIDQVSSADNLCKQFGPRSGPTKCRA